MQTWVTNGLVGRRYRKRSVKSLQCIVELQVAALLSR